MNPKACLAVTAVALVAAFMPVASYADPTSTVQADVTQLTTDVTTAQNPLVPDLTAIESDATAGNLSAVKSDVATYRSDRGTVLPPVQGDLRTLKADLKAARQAGVKGLRQLIEPSLVADRQALAQIRQAMKEARSDVRHLRHSGASDTSSLPTNTPA